jgi:uncharacterized protein YjbJ (UPF0337 family)
MRPSENISKTKWPELRGEVRKAWGQLTDEELDKTEGDMKAIGGLIQKRYGQTQDKYDVRLSEIFKKFEDRKSDSETAENAH